MVKKRKSKVKKEEICEDWCFVCKDGGNIRVCDYKDCLKVYHPNCVGKDDAFLGNNYTWTCDYHYCSLCRKASKFRCFCCPTAAVCGRCLSVAEFAVVKGDKGFCKQCSKLAFLIEENADVDSDGEKIDFKDRDTMEGLFAEYYEIVKAKEGLNSLQIRSARDSIKNGKNKYECGSIKNGENRYDSDQYEIGEAEDDTEESEDASVSEYDDLNDTAWATSVSRKKKCTKKLKPIKGKGKNNKKDFIGWGSRSLIEFLNYIGRDTSREFSEPDVASMIIEYCNKNNLFDPKKKRKVICDAQLRSLLRRKSVNKNNIPNLLASHFLENFEEMDTMTCASEDRENNEPSNCSTPRKLNPVTKSCQSIVSEERQSCFAAIIRSNIKLVYLKKSLIEELLKKPKDFDGKVSGCFVRTKSDPNDYLQKNSHLLQQVVGINTFSKNNEFSKETMLQLSNVPKGVPICKISDDDFSEEECQDLYQRIRDGLLKRPTVLELEQKARTLHEDIMKHTIKERRMYYNFCDICLSCSIWKWIPRELALLQNRIDQANEKGWRRQLGEYMDRKRKLEDPSEQSRLLSEIPKVIPETVDTNPSPQHSSSKDKFEQNDLPELAMGETPISVGQYSKHNYFAQRLDKGTVVVVTQEPIIMTGVNSPVRKDQDDTALPAFVEQLSTHTDSQDKGTSQTKLIQDTHTDSQDKSTSQTKLIQDTSKVRQDDHIHKAALFKESNSDCQTLNAARCGFAQPSYTESGSGVDDRNPSVNRNANQTIERRQSIPAADPIATTINDVIVLSDSDEEDANIADPSVGRKEVEDPDISIWHCSGPYGERGGPYSMSALKLWNDDALFSLEKYKVWKTGQNETQAIPFPTALRKFFPQ